MDKQNDIAYIIVERKKNKQAEGREQLRSYCNGIESSVGVWTNGND